MNRSPVAADALSLPDSLPDVDTDVDVTVRSDADPGLRLTAYLYRQLFDSPPALVASGPGGLTLFGRPGDRFALAIPVKWGAIVAAAPRSDGMVDLRSGSHIGKGLLRPIGALGDPPDWAACPLAVVSSLTAAGHPLGGMSLLVGTGLPDGAGMQSDVALTSVMASALARLHGVELSRAQRAELGDLPAQLASLACPDGTAILVDNERMASELVPFDLLGAGLRLMIVDLGELVGSVPTGPPDLALTAVEAVRSGDLTVVGRLLGQAGELAADGAVLAGAACAAGALGAGTLPGGCLVALVPVGCLREVRSAVTAAWPAERVPKFLTAVASRGGRPIV